MGRRILPPGPRLAHPPPPGTVGSAPPPGVDQTVGACAVSFLACAPGFAFAADPRCVNLLVLFHFSSGFPTPNLCFASDAFPQPVISLFPSRVSPSQVEPLVSLSDLLSVCSTCCFLDPFSSGYLFPDNLRPFLAFFASRDASVLFLRGPLPSACL